MYNVPEVSLEILQYCMGYEDPHCVVSRPEDKGQHKTTSLLMPVSVLSNTQQTTVGQSG